jgi:hypothetical protein
VASQFGWLAAIFEWFSTYILLHPIDKRGMKKEDVKAIYDVSVAASDCLFFDLMWIHVRDLCSIRFLDGNASNRRVCKLVGVPV